MKTEAIEKYMIHNGEILNTKLNMPNRDLITNIVYEVIRVIDGVPLFLEEHMSRLSKSSKMLNINMEHLTDSIIHNIKKLIAINDNPEKNIKVLLYLGQDSSIHHSIFFIQSNYPASELYKKGIHTILFKATRQNPNAKVQNLNLRERINKELLESNAYEALLLNEADEITEGSKSNLFFVKDGSLHTSPKQKVLLGVTRTRVIELAKKLNIEVIEEPIHKSFLEECNGLFITGTSPKILPVSSVNHIEYMSPKNETIQLIVKAYDSLIKDYIDYHK